MCAKELAAKRAVREAAGAVIEALEQRRMLTVCDNSFGPLLTIKGDDSYDNAITLDYNPGTDTVTVKEHGSVPGGCLNGGYSGLTFVVAYGGATPTATTTGNDTIDASALPSGTQKAGQSCLFLGGTNNQ